MKRKSRNRLAAALMLLVMMTFSGTRAYADAYDVRYGDYSGMGVNYVRLDEDITLANLSSFSSTDSRVTLKDRFRERKSAPEGKAVLYKGKLEFGSRNATNDASANTALNEIPGTLKLRWNGKAALPDGTKADIQLTLSELSVRLGANESRAASSGDWYLPFLADVSRAGKTKLGLLAYTPMDDIEDADNRPSHMSGANTGVRLKADIRILKAGTDEPVDASSLLYQVNDLDMPNFFRQTNTGSGRWNDGMKYAEGIELIKGVIGDVALSNRTGSAADDHSILAYSVTDGNTRIQAEGNEQKARIEAGIGFDDANTIHSAATFTASPADFAYYWTASEKGEAAEERLGTVTILFEQPKVQVEATAGEGGSIEKEGTKNYVLNDTTTYDYAPAPGYKVASLTVDGAETPFDPEGGTYTFERLYKDPLAGTDTFTIEVAFEKLPDPPAEPEDPEDPAPEAPEESEDPAPEDPEEPEDPAPEGPEASEDPEDLSRAEGTGANSKTAAEAAPEKAAGPYDGPKTGDASPAAFFTTVGILAVLALLAFLRIWRAGK